MTTVENSHTADEAITCECLCHSDSFGSTIEHVVPCCEPCGLCNLRIKREFAHAHFEQHEVQNPVQNK